MRLSGVLLFLLLWGNVGVSSSLNTCSPLPDVPHALVSDETKKDEYQAGDVIDFTCLRGYTSSQTSKYVCTEVGWVAIRRGKCYSCLPLPDHAFVSDESKKDGYQDGDVIDFTCKPGYTSRQTSKYVCAGGGWVAVRRETCSPSTSSCDPPPAGTFIVKGLPENDGPIGPEHIITVSCEDPGKHLNGSSVLICGEHGQWNTPFPSCIENCKVRDVPSDVYTIPQSPGHELRNGEKLKFGCRSSRHYLRGNAEVECLPDGQWSGPFPTCGDPASCGNPPALEDGDIVQSLKYQYRHGESVKYTCQNLYTMAGGAYRTCSNGQWTGEMKCLKPCTVNKELMDRHNIIFRLTDRQKLYAPHNDVMEFMCIRGTRHDGGVGMRQRCVDGVMALPTCH